MPFIPFQTRPSLFYVYDMNKNSIFKIKSQQFESLINISNGSTDKKDLEIYEEFRTKGMLLDSPIEKVEHPATELLDQQLERCVNSITFQMTQNCNLRCGYCPYSNFGIYDNRPHSSKHVSLEILHKGIDFLIDHSKDVDHLHVSFYGGEPLLAKDLIIETIKYTNNRVNGKGISYGMTTNGTLLKDDFIRQIKDFDISIMISLDGPEKVHNIHRTYVNGKGSYETVYENINFIKKSYPELYKKIKFNTVISPGSNYEEIYQFFRNEELADFSKVSLNTLSTNYTEETFYYGSSFFEERNFELLKTILLLLGKLKNEPITHHKNDIESLFSLKEFFTPIKETSKVAHPSGTCIPGLKKLFVDVDGNFFPCERIDENSDFMKLGSVDKGFNIDKVREILNVGTVTEDVCKNCWAFHCCSFCPASTDNGKENKYVRNYKLKKCHKVKEQALEKLKNYTLLREYKFQFNKELIL
ncbi:radical SAM protein [Paenibacillus sp. CAA11]|uniref:radical SAM protein n=1 Tax=Paenibacillus sp. CAA11 TaxID=1532905 RepID=UPI00131F1379|nr:radical SAM protein [Paenibacillus sp. CAA11]